MSGNAAASAPPPGAAPSLKCGEINAQKTKWGKRTLYYGVALAPNPDLVAGPEFYLGCIGLKKREPKLPMVSCFISFLP